LPIHFARHWLLRLPCLLLLQLRSLMQQERLLCRLLWSRYSLLPWSQRLRRLLPQLLQCLRLRRWLVLFRWLQWLLRWRRWQPLWLLQLWSLLWLPLPGLQLALSPLLSVVLALQVYPKRIPIWPVRFARHWLLQQPLLPLQQQLLLPRPNRLLCRLLWSRCSLLPWSQRLRRLLPQLLQCLRLRRWLVLFRWQRWRLRWLPQQRLSLQSLWWSLRLQLPELRLVLFQLLSVVLA
jgi:hypothetical protein